MTKTSGLISATHSGEIQHTMSWMAATLGSAVVSTLAATALQTELGPVSSHMLSHVMIMGLVAPAAAGVMIWSTRVLMSEPTSLWLATLVQLLLVGLWHTPWLMETIHHSLLLRLGMPLGLLASALWFWLQIAVAATHRPVAAISALIVTGKILCLVGAVLALTSRPLFGSDAGVCARVACISDQHVAGLIMLTACPVIYLGASLAPVFRALRQDMPGET